MRRDKVMTTSQQKNIRRDKLLNEIDLNSVKRYYKEHTFKQTIEWLMQTYADGYIKSDFAYILSLPDMKKSQEEITQMRLDTNKKLYGGGSGRIISTYEPTYDDIYTLYVQQRLSCKQIANKLGVSIRVVRQYKDKYNIKRSKKGTISFSDEVIEKRKQTCLNKYGVDNPMKREEIKQKGIQTKIEKYGEDYSKVLNQRAFDSYKARTGLDNPFQDVENIKRSLMEKYGVDDSNKIPGKVQRAINTWHQHYDNEDNFNDLLNRRRHTTEQLYGDSNYRNIEQCQKTCEEKYGVQCVFLSDDIKFNYKRKDSAPNLEFKALLDSFNIEYEREFIVNQKLYDFKVGKYLIEINPTITHNCTISPWDSPLSKEYHKEKSLLAYNNGFICLHVFDWTDRNSIIDIVLNDTIQDVVFDEPQLLLYDRKVRSLIDEVNEYCLEVYTDGAQFIYKD